jgi:hypothetical protein
LHPGDLLPNNGNMLLCFTHSGLPVEAVLGYSEGWIHYLDVWRSLQLVVTQTPIFGVIVRKHHRRACRISGMDARNNLLRHHRFKCAVEDTGWRHYVEYR